MQPDARAACGWEGEGGMLPQNHALLSMRPEYMMSKLIYFELIHELCKTPGEQQPRTTVILRHFHLNLAHRLCKGPGEWEPHVHLLWNPWLRST